MKIKDLNIKIAMALTLVMMGSPAVKVFAAENTTEPKTTNEILNMDGQTYTNFLIDEFHREYGTTDTFKKVYEGEGIREEVNGKTGEVRTVDTKTNKEIDSFNYIDEVNKLQDDEDTTKEECKNDIKEQVEEVKKEFHEQYGNEDKFVIVYQDNEVKDEINGKTGEFKETYKDTGKVETYNILEEFDNVVKNANLYTDQDEFIETYVDGWTVEDNEGYEDYYKPTVADLEEQKEEAKLEIQKQYGDENKLKTIYEDKYAKEELNPVTGEYRLTNKENNNRVETYNYFTEMDKAIEETKAESNSK